MALISWAWSSTKITSVGWRLARPSRRFLTGGDRFFHVFLYSKGFWSGIVHWFWRFVECFCSICAKVLGLSLPPTCLLLVPWMFIDGFDVSVSPTLASSGRRLRESSICSTTSLFEPRAGGWTWISEAKSWEEKEEVQEVASNSRHYMNLSHEYNVLYTYNLHANV